MEVFEVERDRFGVVFSGPLTVGDVVRVVRESDAADEIALRDTDRDRLREALLVARRDLADVLGAGFDSERRRIATAAHDRITAVLGGDSRG